MLRIPAAGIQGEAALREAATSELREIMELVRGAIKFAMYPENAERYVSMEAIYPTRAIVRHDDGRLYSHPYTLGVDNKVLLGAPEEVVVDHKPVAMRETFSAPHEADSAIIEAVQPEQAGACGLKYRVRILRAGLSKNHNFYSDAALREAAPMFAGVRVFAKSDDEHIAGKGKDFGKLIGRVSEAQFVAGKVTDAGEIQGVMELLESAAPVPQKIYEAYQRGMAKDLFGFSIDADAKIQRRQIGGVPVREAAHFTKVHSLDLIIDPSAGGEILNLVEAFNREEHADMTLRERMIEAIKKAHNGSLPNGLNIEDADALEGAYREAVAAAPATPPAGVSQGDLDRTVRLVEARANLRVLVAESGLPERSRKRLTSNFIDRAAFTDAEIREAIKDEKDYLAEIRGGAHVQNLGEGAFIEAGEGFADKVVKMLDALFDPQNKEVISVKECYIEVTGDKRVTGRIENCDRSRLSEAAGRFAESVDSSTWANALGNALHRAISRDYAQTNRYDVWRRLANVVPRNDFRTNELIRIGGYGDLPAVAQGAPYTALASPTDEKASYAVSKRGGTEDVTLETIKNDDVGSVTRIPTKLSRAAQRTLSKFVLDFLKDNQVIYDAKTLFHADHGNLGATALSAATLAAARLRMLKQTELSSADRLGHPPINLWVPFDLEEVAFDLFRRATNNDTDFVETLQMQVIPVWYWTDPNNWYTTCDPTEMPTIEVGFLDGNEEPELFVQDNPTVGSLFTHDKITYKLRHIYGGTVEDYRGMDGNVVA